MMEYHKFVRDHIANERWDAHLARRQNAQRSIANARNVTQGLHLSGFLIRGVRSVARFAIPGYAIVCSGQSQRSHYAVGRFRCVHLVHGPDVVEKV